jgi:hypothetical protein
MFNFSQLSGAVNKHRQRYIALRRERVREKEVIFIVSFQTI